MSETIVSGLEASALLLTKLQDFFVLLFLNLDHGDHDDDAEEYTNNPQDKVPGL